jgi:DNA-binding winged helix-turn-helix (wHTH) protein/Tfp pilus assembly protein PilF
VTQNRFGRCTFDPETRSVACDGHAIPLTAKSAELLALLLERPGAVISNDVLRERLWPAGFVEPGNLAQQVYVLRRALAVDPGVAIENVSRRGYRLRAAASAADAVSVPWWRRHARSAVASFVAAAALVVLPGGASLVRSRSTNVDAPGERTYALGRYFWERRGEDNLARAQAYFERTIAMAPESALGYAGLAEVWGLRADADMSKRVHPALVRRAVSYARIALAKNAESAVAHAALGLALLESGTYAEMSNPKCPCRNAIPELRRAIELDPRNAEAHEWYGIQLLTKGQLADAALHFEAAAELQPENVAVTTWHAWIRYYLHDFDEAAADFKTALQLNPAFETAQLGLIAALVQRGAYRDAKAALRSMHPHDWSMLRAMHALAAIADLRLGLRPAADAAAVRLQAETRARPGTDDEYVVAALALDGRRVEARRLRARMHLKPYERRMIDLDPLVGPVFRGLGGNV